MRSLLLVGHGSHLNPDSARAVYRYGELLREGGHFDEVVEVFWKEEPSLRQALATARGAEVVAIPVFVSEGYFTEEVIPRELGLAHRGPVPPEGVTESALGRTVRYTPPLGVHPAMEEVIVERAREALAGAGEAEALMRDAALVVIGHGTTRNRNSSRVVYENAGRLRARGLFAEVAALFLDEEPKVTRWASAVRSSLVVMVPFFTAEGWHTRETIPEELGLTGDVTKLGGRTVVYAAPVGTHPRVAEVIERLVAEAAAGTAAEPGENPEHRSAWAAFLERAREGVGVGETVLGPAAPGLFELRPTLDAGRDDLEVLVTPEGVRDRVRLTDGGEYRPVHTLRNLPRGWRAVLGEADLARTMHFLYPGAVEEAHAHETGRLQVTPWPETAGRQTGIYGGVAGADEATLAAVGRELCSSCLKTRLWAGETLSRTFLSGATGGIPCAEACSLFVSEVREAMEGAQGSSVSP